ncbi:UDP-Glycosyltransferase superfamily protein [Wolffia australiana]
MKKKPFKVLTIFLTFIVIQGIVHVTLRDPACSRAPPPRNFSWAGDIRQANFPLNRLNFFPQPELLKIAVFSRKWPSLAVPGGMERHALTLYSSLAQRGHRIIVYTSPLPPDSNTNSHSSLELRFSGSSPGQWRPKQAWLLFKEEDDREPFDVVHSESVALPFFLAKSLPNLAVSWHGIALEALQSLILQALAEDGPLPSDLNLSLHSQPAKVLKEIAFFQNYARHVAITDAAGEMLRDMYQIPAGRVHVVVNGVSEEEFSPDEGLGLALREEIGLPREATLVMGVAGRLVKDKGHRLLHSAFSELIKRHPGAYLVVAGDGPWAERYKSIGHQVVVLGAIPPGKLKAFYNALDVFVNPTLRPQGLDLTLMEAMQCGKPIMATRLPSIKGTLVVQDEFGFLFSPNVEELMAAMEAAMREGPSRLAERGRACRRYAAAMFTARKMAAAYERLFLCIKKESYCSYPLPFDELV